MSSGGWIKLFRSFLNWEWYDDKNCVIVFLHLLLTVNWEPTEWHGITVQAGQRVTTISKLAEEVHLTPKQDRVVLKKLEKTGELWARRGTNPETSNFSVITLKNWGLYQEEGQTMGTEEGNARETQGQQYKKEKKEKKKEYITRRRARGSYDLEAEAERALARFAKKEAKV